jgi:hypothetical protein
MSLSRVNFRIETLLQNMLVDCPASADYRFGIMSAMRQADDSDAHGRRVWWRWPVSGRHFSHYYKSRNPGESRTTPPEGPGNVIREAPPRDPSCTFSTLLRQEIERFNANPPPSGSELEELVSAARRVVNKAQGESDAAVMEEFRRMEQEWLAGHVADKAADLRRLFGFYSSYAIAGELFAPAFAILRAEIGTDCWHVEEKDVWADPLPYALGLLPPIWRDNPDRRPAFVEVANASFVEAETELSAAFNAPTQLLFLRRLYSGCALSLEALTNATAIERGGGMGMLDYSVQLADEHFAWGMAGLAFAIPELYGVIRDQERRRSAVDTFAWAGATESNVISTSRHL